MLVPLSRLEIRELIRCVEGTDIDTDLLHLLESFIKLVDSDFRPVSGGESPMMKARQNVIDMLPIQHDTTQRAYLQALAKATAPESDLAPIVPKMVWSPELAQTYDLKVGWKITNEEVERMNADRQKASDEEWQHARSYRPSVDQEGNGVVTAAFVQPDRPRAPGWRESFAIGDLNANDDACVRAGTYTTAAFRCSTGHGYTLNGTVAGCPQCWMNGGGAGTTKQRDENDIEGEESF